MGLPKEITELIERFDRNRESYLTGQYNETQLRREFLDPFFSALGWDVENKAGLAEMYKDVVHEDAVKIGGATKAPDYSFRIGGTRKFFLEAKKPSVHIKEEISPAQQIRYYARNAALPLSILSNFAEFAVYDGRVKRTSKDKASTARVLYLTYKDYAEKWEEIASIFSKDAVLKGAFDKYADTTRIKKGTAPIDEDFLKDIESWRDHLARNIALRNPDLSNPEEMNYCVQRTIDRIIFLRICEDRGIEEYGRLQALLNGTNVYKRLLQFFVEADDRYNSGLFHFQREKDRHEEPDKLTPQIEIDDKPLKDIFKSLYGADCDYDFYYISADILGKVYEQFLGKVIRLTDGHQAKVELKPEVRKAGGVYYTPKYIVDYIVENTVGKLVENKKPKEVEKLKILDPACGSGSFLLGAYQYLLDWHLKWYIENQPEKWAKAKQPTIYQGPSSDPRIPNWHLTTPEKKRILLNNIYGVDIDSQAVEVTKLSLLLKVLEGENSQTLQKQLTYLHERALPDLGDNIKCGNSLIGPDFYQQQTMLDDEELYRINVFDWKKEFPHVFTPSPRAGEGGGEGGFDAVIGNPPYGATFKQEETNYMLRQFSLQEYQLDSYLLFAEKALTLVRKQGSVGVIIPNTWLLNLLTPQIRKHIFDNAQIVEIVHYRHPVFKDATVDTEVIIFQEGKPRRNHEINVTIVDNDNVAEKYGIPQTRWQMGNGKPVNIFERPEFIQLADKLGELPVLDLLCEITQGAKPFQVGKGKPPQTREIVDEKPFVSEKRRDASFRPLLRGSLIHKYKILWNKDYWISFGDWLAEPRYSAKYDAAAKIVIRQTGDSLIAALDTKQFIVRDNLYAVVTRAGNAINIKFILGALNSRLLNWYYQNIINPEKGEALAQVKRGHLAKLPFPVSALLTQKDKASHDKMVSLVDRMLSLNKQLPAAKTDHEKTALQRQTDAIDRQIDQLVYELYGLTEKEIRIVEGKA